MKGAQHAGSNNCSTFLNIRFSPRAPCFRNAPPDLKNVAPPCCDFFCLFVLPTRLGGKKIIAQLNISIPEHFFFCFSNCHRVDSSLNPFSDGDLTQLKKCNTCRTVQTSWKVANGRDNAWRIGVAHESKSWPLCFISLLVRTQKEMNVDYIAASVLRLLMQSSRHPARDHEHEN